MALITVSCKCGLIYDGSKYKECPRCGHLKIFAEPNPVRESQQEYFGIK